MARGVLGSCWSEVSSIPSRLRKGPCGGPVGGGQRRGGGSLRGAGGPKTEEYAAGGARCGQSAMGRRGPGKEAGPPAGSSAVRGTGSLVASVRRDLLSDLWVLLSFAQGASAELL